MLKLTHGDRNAKIAVVEDPHEVVSRLGHLDTDSPELSKALMRLGPNRLLDVANQVQTALVRVGVQTIEPVPQKREVSYQTFELATDFGD